MHPEAARIRPAFAVNALAPTTHFAMSSSFVTPHLSLRTHSRSFATSPFTSFRRPSPFIFPRPTRTKRVYTAPARPAHLIMKFTSPNSSSSSSSSSSNNHNNSNNSENSENNNENDRASDSDTDREKSNYMSSDEDATSSSQSSSSSQSQSPSSSTEFRFNQEVLRRRMAALNKNNKSNKNSSANSVLDLSILADAQYDFDENAFNDNDDSIEAVISHESMSEDEADHFIDSFARLDRVWVILFTNARDGTDGIYSLSVGNDNIVLAFEERYEAQRYAVCLEAQKFPEPQICEMDPDEIRAFCVDSGLKLGFIPAGMIITPPEESAIDDLDKWRGKPSSDQSTGMTDEDIDAMRRRLDSLFGQQ